VPRRRRTLALCALTTLALAPSAARATTVTYVKDGDVYAVPAAGGSAQLVAAKQGEVWFNSVAQADNGRLVAVRNERGKISTLSWYTLFGPDGSTIRESPLPGQPGWQIYAYPLGIDLTADGKFMAYGYSNSSYNGSYQFDNGTYFVGAENYNSLQPLWMAGYQQPAWVGDRLVAVTSSGGGVYVNRDPGYADGTKMDSWLTLSLGAGEDVTDLDVDATGQTLAFALTTYAQGSSTVTAARALLVRTAGLGGAYVDDCVLPAAGKATGVAVSADGTQVAWIDDEGVKVAGAPRFDGPATCNLSSPAVVVGPAGASDLAIGAFAPPAPAAPAAPGTPSDGGTSTPAPGAGTPAAPGTPGTPGTGSTTTAQPLTATLPASRRAAALRAGWRLTVRSAAAGTAAATLTVRGRVIATGSVKLAAGRAATLRLKATKAAARRLKAYRGKRATLVVRVGKARTTRTVRLT
jgi:hypothetical protein